MRTARVKNIVFGIRKLPMFTRLSWGYIAGGSGISGKIEFFKGFFPAWIKFFRLNDADFPSDDPSWRNVFTL